MEKSSIEKNLTEGSVAKQLIQFALPFMLSNLIQTLYNVADMLIVGIFLGSVGISGVNIGGQVTFIITNIVVGLSVGGTVVIAQFLGSGDRKSMNESIKTLITFLLVMAVIITVAMMLLSDGILRLIQTPEESYKQARDYLNVTLLGTIFIFGYNAFSAILRGLGDSKRPLIFVSIACIINIFLDLLFVGAFGMEAMGAALATIISQAISMIACIIYLKRSNFEFDFKLSSFRFYKERFFMLMRVGIPISIQNVITNLSFLVLTTIANGMGVSESAAIGIVGKYNGFAILPAIAVGSSVSAMVAQNMGAGRIDRAKKTLHVGFILAFTVSLVVFTITRLFPEQILRLFGDDPDMIVAGVEYMKTFTFDYLIVPAAFCLNGIITGSGHTIVSSFSGIMSSLGFRIPFAILFGLIMQKGMWGLGLAAPLASFGTTIIVLTYYLSGKWKISTVINKDKD
ncbi:MAG: MATE family efflux transporter [Clostridiaceae bacterium]|nr:MATE family efflux transporter [Clostridiaceae bacterium]